MNDTSISLSTANTKLHRQLHIPVVQNFHLVWLDESLDEDNNDECCEAVMKLRQIVNTINTFTDVDECIDFITDIEHELCIMLVSELLFKRIAFIIPEIHQITSVYIYHHDKSLSKYSSSELQSKVKGIHTNITSICEALQKTTQDCDRNSINISVVKPSDETANKVSDLVDSSFMYTQLLKEIILTIDFEQQHINEFLMYCRQQSSELKHIDMIEKDYRPQQAIWWYTYSRLLYTMLNRALRLMEVDLIIKMGFFVRDLHNHIAELHLQQYSGPFNKEPFVVYRGQSLSLKDFNDLKDAQGGLLSFNNFLSTSLSREVSLAFADGNQRDPNRIDILFQITIDPSIPSSIFANVKDFSNFKEEEEILFSMHSIFRIELVNKIDGNDRHWQVDLTLVHENNSQLHVLTEQLREETFPKTKGWYRLGTLLITLGQFDKAKQVFDIMLHQTTDQREKANIYSMLGAIKNSQGHYTEAIESYEKSLGIYKQTLPANHPDLATSYNNIGLVYESMGDYSKALEYYEKDLEIMKKALPANHPDLATSCNNIGNVYNTMGGYSKALEYYAKSLEIRKIALPQDHPDLATSYNNIGLVYESMGDYSKALEYYEKDLEISKKALPANHPSLATSYNNIGNVYNTMGGYSKALEYYAKSLEIKKIALPQYHPSLATSYNNIGLVYDRMGEYSKALEYYEKSLEIYKQTLPANHPDLATSYNNIGMVYESMGEYSKALEYYEKSLEIRKIALPENHPSLATSYNNIGLVYDRMGEYSKALEYYEKSLEIRKIALPENHPSLATSYNNIGLVYKSIGEYSKALEYYKKSLEIMKNALLENHPSLATSYNNIGNVYNAMGDYSKALEYYGKSLEIKKKALSENHPSLATSYNNIGMVYDSMGEYSGALDYFDRALDIWQLSLPSNHPNIQVVKESIDFVKKKLLRRLTPIYCSKTTYCFQLAWLPSKILLLLLLLLLLLILPTDA